MACRFPLPQVAQRLLQIGAGLWPEGASGAPAATAADMIDATLAACLGEDCSPAIAVLQQLLCEATPLVASQTAQQLARRPNVWQTVCAVCQVRASHTACAAAPALLSLTCDSRIWIRLTCRAAKCCDCCCTCVCSWASKPHNSRLAPSQCPPVVVEGLTRAWLVQRHQRALSAKAQEAVGNQFSYQDGSVARDVTEFQDALRLFVNAAGQQQQEALQPQRAELEALQRDAQGMQDCLRRGY